MKKFIVVLLLFIIFAYTPCSATEEQELFNNGILLFNKGQYAEAVEQFSKMIKTSPNNADAYNNRGASYIRLKQFDLAIADFEKVKEISPDLKGLYSNIGTVMYYKEEYEKALLNYDMEIDKEADNYLAYFNKALCLLKLERDDEALQNIDKSIVLKPDFYWAHCFKGDILVRQKSIEKAIESYEDAVHLNSDTPYAKDQLAKLSAEKTVSAMLPPKTEKKALIQANNIAVIRTTKVEKLSVQIGAYLNSDNAEQMKAKLIEGGFDANILILKDSEKSWHLVRYGQYSSFSEAKEAVAAIKEKLGTDAVIRPADTW